MRAGGRTGRLGLWYIYSLVLGDGTRGTGGGRGRWTFGGKNGGSHRLPLRMQVSFEFNPWQSDLRFSSRSYRQDYHVGVGNIRDGFHSDSEWHLSRFPPTGPPNGARFFPQQLGLGVSFVINGYAV